MLVLSGTTANDVWLDAAHEFRAAGTARSQPSRDGDTLELLHVAFEISDPRQRWVASRVPAINPAFALAEVIWILSGSRDAEFLNTWNPSLPRFCGPGPTYHGAYGYRLRRHLGFDQLQRAYEALSSNPDTRQVVLQIWDGTVDLPKEDGEPANADIPCNVASFLKVRAGRLEWMQVMRSNDLFLGAPHNFVQFTSLQEVISGWLGVTPGTYTHVTDSLQVYLRNRRGLDLVKRCTAPTNVDRLDLSKPEFDRAFTETHLRARAMMVSQSTADLHQLTRSRSLPEGYANIIRVLGADVARRHDWLDLALELRAECSNPALAMALDGWFARTIQEYHPQENGVATVLLRQ